MLRKLYNGLVFLARPFAALLAAVRRRPLWAQVVIVAFVIVVVTVVVLSLVLPCPPEIPDCGPWDQLMRWCGR